MATDQVSTHQGDEQIGQDSDEPFSYSGTSTALFGLAIALLSVSVPLVAVVAERAAGSGRLPPTAYDHGSATVRPISFNGVDTHPRGNSGWQPE